MKMKPMNRNETVRDRVADINPDALFADGFDDAVIGIDSKDLRVVYDYDKMVSILMKQGMDELTANEHLEYNVVGAYMGEMTPIYIDYFPVQLSPTGIIERVIEIIEKRTQGFLDCDVIEEIKSLASTN